MKDSFKNFDMSYFSLKNKVAIVTGANQGLGMAYAVAFARAGADLYIPHLTKNIEKIKELIQAEGRKVVFIQGDLRDKEYLEAVVSGCIREYGKIDILVNNAGVSIFEEFEKYSDEAWQRCIDIDLNAVYYLSHRVAKKMIKEKSGKIINIASALSFTADKNCPPYPTAKHAIIGLTRTFANELGKYNIQTNAIAPGFFETEMTEDLRKDPLFYNKITNRIPTGRWGKKEDLMGVAVFLASKASDYINGWAINIDGGFATTL